MEPLLGEGQRALGAVLDEEGLCRRDLVVLPGEPVRHEHHVAVAVVAVREQVIQTPVERLARLEDPLEKGELLEQLRLLVAFFLREVGVGLVCLVKEAAAEGLEEVGRAGDARLENLVDRHDHCRLEVVKVFLLELLDLGVLVRLGVGFDGRRFGVTHGARRDLFVEVQPEGLAALLGRLGCLGAQLGAALLEPLLDFVHLGHVADGAHRVPRLRELGVVVVDGGVVARVGRRQRHEPRHVQVVGVRCVGR